MMLTTSLLIGIAVKSIILAALTLALLRLAHLRTSAEKSLIAHLGLLAILLLPLAALTLPQWAPLPDSLFSQPEVVRVALGSPDYQKATATSATAPLTANVPATMQSISTAEIAAWFYGLPLMIMFTMMIVAVVRLFGMRRRAEVLVDSTWLKALAEAQRRMGFKHGTALLVSDELRSPISWGVLRPTILLDPRALSSTGDAEAIIAHELAHVARLDWAKLLVARLACALFWFNPLVWLLARESHHLREEAADDSVLLTDISGSDYATLLLNAARHDNRAVLIAAHGVAPAKNSLRRRVIRVLDATVRRGPVRSAWTALSIALVAAVTAPLAAFSTTAAQPEQNLIPANGGDPTALQIDRPEFQNRSFTARARTAAAKEASEDLQSGLIPAKGVEAQNHRKPIGVDDIIAAKATGVTPDYISQMRQMFRSADLDELIDARAVGVDLNYVKAMRALEPETDLDAIVGARAVGVTPGYAQQIRTYFPRATLEELVSMRALGVSGRDIDNMRAAGSDVDEPDDVVSVKALKVRRLPGPRNARRTENIVGARNGATVVIGPEGVTAIRREADGTTRTVTLNRPPPTPYPPDADE